MHSSTDLALLFWSYGWGEQSSCSSMSLEDGEILRFCFSKAIIYISPQPEATGHALLSMLKNVSSQHWGKFWNKPGVPGMQTQYRHWQICVNSFGALCCRLQIGRLTPYTDHRSITLKCQAFVTQNSFLSSFSMRDTWNFFSFALCPTV